MYEQQFEENNVICNNINNNKVLRNECNKRSVRYVHWKLQNIAKTNKETDK